MRAHVPGLLPSATQGRVSPTDSAPLALSTRKAQQGRFAFLPRNTRGDPKVYVLQQLRIAPKLQIVQPEAGLRRQRRYAFLQL